MVSKQKEESSGFSARLKALVQAFHVASEAPYVEDFAAGKIYVLLLLTLLLICISHAVEVILRFVDTRN